MLTDMSYQFVVTSRDFSRITDNPFLRTHSVTEDVSDNPVIWTSVTSKPLTALNIFSSVK